MTRPTPLSCDWEPLGGPTTASDDRTAVLFNLWMDGWIDEKLNSDEWRDAEMDGWIHLRAWIFSRFLSFKRKTCSTCAVDDMVLYN